MKKMLKEKYLELSRKGAAFIKKGNFRQAYESYSAAKDIALRLQSKELFHKCIANMSLVQTELGDYKKAERGLRDIIINSIDNRIICAASYSLAISLRKQGRYIQALKYARIAMQKSIALNDLDARAKVHNLIGNIYLYQTYIDNAITEYAKALSLREMENTDNRFSMAILKENIGYCHILKKNYEKGIAIIREALKLALLTGNRRCTADCYQDICYAYMLVRKLKSAEKLGERALKLAFEKEYEDIVKNCYYLLGEINFLRGHKEKMNEYFQKLQEFYPHLPFLKDFLSKFDVSEIITLKQ